MELKGKIVNFLGDSITEGVGASSPEHVYPHLIKEKYGLAKANNYGISGTRFAKQTKPSEPASFDLDFCSRVAEMDPEADAVVVFGGTNDFGHGDAPIGTPEDRTKDTFWGACHELMSSLVKKYPGKPVVICTPLHRISEHIPTGDNKPEPVAVLDEYIAIIRTVAQYYALPVLDLNGVTGIQPRVPEIKEALCPDGLHPNDAGQAILAKCIGNFLSYNV